MTTSSLSFRRTSRVSVSALPPIHLPFLNSLLLAFLKQITALDYIYDDTHFGTLTGIITPSPESTSEPRPPSALSLDLWRSSDQPGLPPLATSDFLHKLGPALALLPHVSALLVTCAGASCSADAWTAALGGARHITHLAVTEPESASGLFRALGRRPVLAPRLKTLCVTGMDVEEVGVGEVVRCLDARARAGVEIGELVLRDPVGLTDATREAIEAVVSLTEN